MQRLSDSAREFLREATERYHSSLPGSPGEVFLKERGLGFPSLLKEDNARFKLGFVEEPLRGHEQYRGMLAIPYLRWSREHGWSVVSMRFRNLGDGAKYLTTAGDQPRLFNTLALLRPVASMCITEGELDTVAAEASSLASVAVPGSTAWQQHFREPFLGYRNVYVLADGDEAGLKFGRSVAKTLPNARVIPCPDGEDVNSVLLAGGPEAVRSLVQ